MILSHKHKFIFMKTRKTGGTSIELALRHICGERDVITPVNIADEERYRGRGPQNYILPKHRWPLRELWRRARGDKTIRGRPSRALQEHAYAPQLHAAHPKAWKSYFKFSVERNPWDRQVSWYYWRHKRRAHRPSFEEFMLRSDTPFILNWDVYAMDDRIVVDRVLRFEHLAEDFAAVMAHLGVADVPELGAWKGNIRPKTESYRAYYDDRTRDLVAAWYAREIAAFGYEF